MSSKKPFCASSPELDGVRLLTVRDVAHLLGFHERTCWRMEQMKQIPPALTIGRKARRWRYQDIRKFLDNGGRVL